MVRGRCPRRGCTAVGDRCLCRDDGWYRHRRCQCWGCGLWDGAPDGFGIIRASSGHQPQRCVPHPQVRDAARRAQSRPCDGRGVGDIVHAAGRYGLCAASKAGVEMLALTYRQEWRTSVSRSGLCHPSWIDTGPHSAAPRRTCPPFRSCAHGCAYPGNVTTSVDRAGRRDSRRTRAPSQPECTSRAPSSSPTGRRQP